MKSSPKDKETIERHKRYAAIRKKFNDKRESFEDESIREHIHYYGEDDESFAIYIKIGKFDYVIPLDEIKRWQLTEYQMKNLKKYLLARFGNKS